MTSRVRRETRGGPYTVKSQNLCAPFFEPRRNIVENLASDMSFERSRHAAAAIGVSARIHYTLGTATYIYTRIHTHKHICIKLLFLVCVRFPLSLFFFYTFQRFSQNVDTSKNFIFYSPFFQSVYTWYDNNICTLYNTRTYTYTDIAITFCYRKSYRLNN